MRNASWAYVAVSVNGGTPKTPQNDHFISFLVGEPMVVTRKPPCEESTQMVVVSKICLYLTPKLGEDEPNLTSMFFKWVGSTTNYRYSKGPWKWTCQHDHIFEGSLSFPYHAAMGIDSLNFQGSFGAGDWSWFLMKKTGSVVKYLISELGSHIYIYFYLYTSHTSRIYTHMNIVCTQIYIQKLRLCIVLMIIILKHNVIYIYIYCNKPLFQTFLFSAPQNNASKVFQNRQLATVETWRHAGGPWDERK